MSSPTPSPLRIPPQNLDAEKALLGSVMLRPDGLSEVMDVIFEASFYGGRHRLIWRTMLELHSRNVPIDLLSLSSRLTEKGELEAAGGATYLTELTASVPSSTNLKHYAEIIQKKQMMRALIDAAEFLGELGYNEAEDLDHLLDRAEKRVFEITQRSGVHKFVDIKDTLTEAWERLDRLHNSGDALRGVPTGFKELDSKLAGFQKSDLIILAARPSMGKTSLALDIARNVALKENLPVGFFSIEMSSEQVVDRLIATQAAVDLWRLRTGRLSDAGEDNDFVRIRDAMGTLSQIPLYIDDVASPTVMQIRAMARRLQAEHGALGLVVVDYLQLIRGHENAESRVQEVSQISRALKAMAKELNIPVLALSQLSRAVEMRADAVPKLSDLRESGSIEQDADVVMFIYREDKVKKNTDRKNIAEILIEKHRNGPTGRVDLYFNEETVSFRSIAKHFKETE